MPPKSIDCSIHPSCSVSAGEGGPCRSWRSQENVTSGQHSLAGVGRRHARCSPRSDPLTGASVFRRRWRPLPELAVPGKCHLRLARLRRSSTASIRLSSGQHSLAGAGRWHARCSPRSDPLTGASVFRRRRRPLPEMKIPIKCHLRLARLRRRSALG